MKKSVFAILKDRPQAETALERLRSAGFLNNDISMLFADTSGTRDFAYEHSTKAPEGTATGGTTGFVIGGVLGWLAGIGSLAIPGLGPFIAAGPIMSALSGAAVGTAVGGIVGALVGMGIPEFEARRYESKVKEGNILVSIHSENAEMAERAKEILKACEAQDIATGSEIPVTEEEQQPRNTGGGTPRSTSDQEPG